MTFMEQKFGLNWRTSVSGILSKVMTFVTIMAALPYEKDKATSATAIVWSMVPLEWQPGVLKTCAIAALVTGIWNALVQRDKQVSDSDQQQTKQQQ